MMSCFFMSEADPGGARPVCAKYISLYFAKSPAHPRTSLRGGRRVTSWATPQREGEGRQHNTERAAPMAMPAAVPPFVITAMRSPYWSGEDLRADQRIERGTSEKRGIIRG